MSETDKGITLTIWSPDGLSAKHWVHRIQNTVGTFGAQDNSAVNFVRVQHACQPRTEVK